MKSATAINTACGPQEIVCGLFTKKEAARIISGGTPHLHSYGNGSNDSLACLTRDAVQNRTIAVYPWEKALEAHSLTVRSSQDRARWIDELTHSAGLQSRRDLREKVHSVIEEILSNALYHAYRTPSGEPKYRRQETVQLQDNEILTVGYYVTVEGAYLRVQDRGGSLSFSTITESFHRCYSTSCPEIETKESGAGLGMYLTFETCTRLKIVTQPTRQTTVSCWISDRSLFDPSHFSFNFFFDGEKT